MDSEVIFRAADMPDLGTHPISYRLVGHSRANRAIGMMQEILPPGADTGDDMLSHGRRVRHRHPGSGGGHGRRAGSPADAGGWRFFDSRTPHRFRNVDEHECVLISANTPASFWP
jgi:hypothetical protein